MMKIDICKAYDNVSRDFPESSLIGFVFPSNFVALIMKCLSLPSYSVNVKVLVVVYLYGGVILRIEACNSTDIVLLSSQT